MNGYGLSMASFLGPFGVCALLSFISAPWYIPMLRRLKFGQTVRADGPSTHLQKNGTPTMGGMIFLVALLAGFLVLGRHADGALFLLSTLLFGLVGFLDDYIKVVRRQSLGLRAWQKIVLQIAFAFLMAFWLVNSGQVPSSLKIPFFPQHTVDLGILIIPYLMFFMIAVVNSANLTDGVDGLASSVTLIIFLFFAYAAYRAGQGSVFFSMGAAAGALAGFLRVNWFPAKVFMGDLGSMALGGMVAFAAVRLNLTLFVPLACLVYFMESVSVMLQVFWFKKTGRRLFKMAPIHHHFELLGMSELRVVQMMCAITVLGTLLMSVGL